MTPRTPILLALLLALCCSLALAACGSGGGSTTPEPWEAKQKATSWVVVVDVTQSTHGEAREAYLGALARVLEAVHEGDHLVVLSAGNESLVDSEYWVEEELPSYAFTPSPAPASDNELLVDAWRSQQSEAYAAGLATYRKTNNLGAWREQVLAAVRPHIRGEVAQGSDLLSAVALAGTLFSAHGERRLVLLSDGLVQAGGVNWRSGDLSRAAVQKVIAKQRASGALAELGGAQMLLVGAGGEAARFPALRAAWRQYIGACGGTLEERFFMSRLSETLVGTWTADGAGGAQ